MNQEVVKTAVGKKPNAPLFPPQRWTVSDLHHWVERFDKAGVALEMEVWRWNPEDSNWSRPKERGVQQSDLKGYAYVGVCPVPPKQDDVDEALKIYRPVLESSVYLAASEEERATFRRLWAHHIGCILPVKGRRESNASIGKSGSKSCQIKKSQS